MTDFFPALGAVATTAPAALPMLRDVAVDENGLPRFLNGAPVISEGKEAVRLWALTALGTQRYHYGIYDGTFGAEVATLMGRGFADEVVQAELPRMVREALLQNPYISDVTEISVQRGDTSTEVRVTCTIITIYGEVGLDAGI